MKLNQTFVLLLGIIISFISCQKSKIKGEIYDSITTTIYHNYYDKDGNLSNVQIEESLKLYIDNEIDIEVVRIIQENINMVDSTYTKNNKVIRYVNITPDLTEITLSEYDKKSNITKEETKAFSINNKTRRDMCFSVEIL